MIIDEIYGGFDRRKAAVFKIPTKNRVLFSFKFLFVNCDGFSVCVATWQNAMWHNESNTFFRALVKNDQRMFARHAGLERFFFLLSFKMFWIYKMRSPTAGHQQTCHALTCIFTHWTTHEMQITQSNFFPPIFYFLVGCLFSSFFTLLFMWILMFFFFILLLFCLCLWSKKNFHIYGKLQKCGLDILRQLFVINDFWTISF